MSTRRRQTIITGFMGAGKTTVARALARKLDCSMIDLDEFIEAREGQNVGAIIEDGGEANFRRLETRALREVLSESEALIIALGGGTWTLECNRALILACDALTVWLDAPFELCWRRIMNAGRSRPLARDEQRARRLYDKRRALYGLAQLRIEVRDEKSASDIAAEILRRAADFTNNSSSNLIDDE